MNPTNTSIINDEQDLWNILQEVLIAGFVPVSWHFHPETREFVGFKDSEGELHAGPGYELCEEDGQLVFKKV